MYAQVMVDIANANVDRLFTYAVPEDLPIQKRAAGIGSLRGGK